jgi:uncharacterized protein
MARIYSKSPAPLYRASHKAWEHKVDFWQVLPVALALVLILEGMLPFLSPRRWREMLDLVAQLEDRTIRRIGFGSMLLGLIVLYWVNG